MEDVPSIPITPIEPIIPTKPTITQSILLTVKKMLGIAEEYHAFDVDLITDINSVFLSCYQLAIGPTEEPFQIMGEEETWEDFLGDEKGLYPGVRTYIYLKVRLLFDPPTASFHVEAMQNQCKEFEWRLNLQGERRKSVGTRSESSPTVDDRSLRDKVAAIPKEPTRFYR